MTAVIDKKALGQSLCSELVELCNKHGSRWGEIGLDSEARAGILTGALVNLVGNVAIAVSPDYIVVAERIVYSIMQFVYRHKGLEETPTDVAN